MMILLLVAYVNGVVYIREKSEESILKIFEDVLNAGKMDERKDLSNFAKGHWVRVS